MNYIFRVEEKRILNLLKQNSFYSKPLSRKAEKEAIWIMMAPPNMTGPVHLGHIWDFIIPDFYSRYFNLLDKKVVYVPGKDHAGIATQVKVEENIRKSQNIDKLSQKEKMLIAKNWVKKHSKQTEKVWDTYAISCNRNYEKYTLDVDVENIIIDLFIDYFKKGLVYLDDKIINWDLELQTVISNEEVIKKCVNSHLYYVKYPIKNTDDFIVVATTRPETIFSDVCLFINPEKKLKSRNITVLNPLTNKELKILEDSFVDDSFGSGVLKCTPQHDLNDFELYKKHNLPLGEPSIDKKGIMTSNALKYEGMKMMDARRQIVKDLTKKNKILKVDEIESEKSYSFRSGSLVEPLISKQWFFKVSSFSKNAFKNFLENSKFQPKYFDNKLLQWGTELKDWCISRQLWWGLRMPIYKSEKGEFIAARNNPDSSKWFQINDVFDTWFISGHWPIILNKIFKRGEQPFHCVGMGTDIFFFWAVRMILTQFQQTKKHPFNLCLFHGILRDEKGNKMSKSLGNGVDPIEEAKNESTDAIRWALFSRNNYGYDINYKKNMINEAHSLIKKITSIITYFERKMEQNEKVGVSANDFKALINSLTYDISTLWKDCHDLVQKNKLNLYCLKIRQFIMKQISSNYINLFTYSVFTNQQYLSIIYLLKSALMILEPIMPFFNYYLLNTIHILVNNADVENFFIAPKTLLKKVLSTKAKKDNTLFNLAFDIKAEIRNLIKKGVCKFYILKKDKFQIDIIQKYLNVVLIDKVEKDFKETIFKKGGIEISLFWRQTKRDRGIIQMQIKKTEFEIERAKKILSNKQFILKAPKHLVNKEREQLKHHKKHLRVLKKSLDNA